MKSLSDKEIQDLLDSQREVDISKLGQESQIELEQYQQVYAALKQDEYLTGAPFDFSQKVTRAIFIDEERKKDQYQLFLIPAMVLVALSIAGLTFSFYDISIPCINTLSERSIFVGLFVLVLFVTIQTIDFKLTSSSKQSRYKGSYRNP